MIHRRGEEVDMIMCLDDPFVPYATMFKLDEPDSNTVKCIACSALFALADLLGSELEEDKCPKCHNHAARYWRRFRHRTVPKEN